MDFKYKLNFCVLFCIFYLCFDLNIIVEGTTPLQVIRKQGRSLSQNDRRMANTPRARLPMDLLPSHYQLTLMPIIDDAFIIPGMQLYETDGTVTITMNCLVTTRTIILHASEKITFRMIRVTLVGTITPIPVVSNSTIPEDDFYIISVGSDLIAGREYNINIRFIAPVATDLIDGLYLSKYTPPGSTVEKHIAVTQFASKAARRAFPCFDEPGIKTTFNITIGRTAKYNSLSNSKLIDTQEIPGVTGWFQDTFDTTVKMSTYLVAIIVSEYKYEQADLLLPDGQPVRVYAPEHMIDDQKGGLYSSAISAQIMTFYHEYFQMEYKMSKMDSAMVPDFYFGAMENWGLITYREIFIMYYEGITTETERGRINNIIAHESSHQWFGNLITCKWWNHVWLNEGFATYLAPIAVNLTHPEFEPLKRFLNDVVQVSMFADSNPITSHPIRDNDSISSPKYDDINYEKAASLIRMMEGFLTPKVLKQGIQKFLQKWEFKAVVQDDLFLVLNEEAHNEQIISPDITIKDIMDTWTRQSGYPLVRVSKGFVENTIQISQERFIDDLPSGDMENNELWYIPISMATQNNPDFLNYIPKFWIDKNTAVRTYNHNVSTWIMLNPDATGYYRVLYDSHLLLLIKKQLQNDFTIISPGSRSQLFDDYFTMAFHGFVRIETALELTSYLNNETDAIVWYTVFTNLDYSLRMLSGTVGLSSFRNYILPKIHDAILKVGFLQPIGEKGVKVLLRLQLLDWACALELESCLTYSLELFTEWMSNPDQNPIPIDLQPVVYCAAVGHGGVTAFEFVLKHYEDLSTSVKQKQLLLNALACTKEIYLLQMLLDETLNATTSKFSEADRVTIIHRVFLNSIGQPIVIKFIREYFHVILAQVSQVNQFISLFNNIGQYCKTPEELEQIQDFATIYKDELIGDVESVMKSTLASIEININWMKSYFQAMHDWFLLQI